MDQKQVKLLVGVPMLAPSYEFFLSWNSFWTDLVRSAKFEIACQFKYRMPTFIAHEELAREAVKTGATHLLLIDDDILDVSLLDLIKLLEADKDFIGGVMLTKKFPFQECALRRLDPEKPLIDHAMQVTGFDMYAVPKADQVGVKPVDLLSFGFSLFKTDLFKKIGEPYFVPDITKNDHYKLMTFTDSIFLDKCLKKGIQPYAHFDVWLNHGGVTKDNVNEWVSMYKKAGKLTQPGLKMDQKEYLKYKMVVKEKMSEAEARFHSDSLEKIKYFKEVEDQKEVADESSKS